MVNKLCLLTFLNPPFLEHEQEMFILLCILWQQSGTLHRIFVLKIFYTCKYHKQ
jgi:hypothetical protein